MSLQESILRYESPFRFPKETKKILIIANAGCVRSVISTYLISRSAESIPFYVKTTKKTAPYLLFQDTKLVLVNCLEILHILPSDVFVIFLRKESTDVLIEKKVPYLSFSSVKDVARTLGSYDLPNELIDNSNSDPVARAIESYLTPFPNNEIIIYPKDYINRLLEVLTFNKEHLQKIGKNLLEESLRNVILEAKKFEGLDALFVYRFDYLSGPFIALQTLQKDDRASVIVAERFDSFSDTFERYVAFRQEPSKEIIEKHKMIRHGSIWKYHPLFSEVFPIEFNL